MLFNSLPFLSIFLPIVVAGFFLSGLIPRSELRRTLQLSWLTLASLVFYGAWAPPYVLLLLGSVLVNFFIGRRIRPESEGGKRVWVVLGVSFNLALLGYFKYADFFLGSLGWLFSIDLPLLHLVLPLAISFFTFQQIAYLVDCRQGVAGRYEFLEYVFFVCFFPQLIAGPIVHHYEMLPQIARTGFTIAWRNLVVGSSIFLVGIFKKMVLADVSAEYADAFYSGVSDGITFGAVNAWVGVIAYTFQIYFDFSGYSDMAIGLARMFGIVLPQNFNAPYRATNIAEFWRRWHITLSRFLRDYLYIPLGGNRRGRTRRYVNLMVTMLLGGLWHGAAWTFVAWGFLHGLYLCIHRFWVFVMFQLGMDAKPGSWPERLLRPVWWLLTVLCVVVAWVFFRADNFQQAMAVFSMLTGGGGEELPWHLANVFRGSMKIWWFSLLTLAVLLLPTTQPYFANENAVLEDTTPRPWLAWRPGLLHGVLMGVLLFLVVHRFFQAVPTPFLYFNF